MDHRRVATSLSKKFLVAVEFKAWKILKLWTPFKIFWQQAFVWFARSMFQFLFFTLSLSHLMVGQWGVDCALASWISWVSESWLTCHSILSINIVFTYSIHFLQPVQCVMFNEHFVVDCLPCWHLNNNSPASFPQTWVTLLILAQIRDLIVGAQIMAFTGLWPSPCIWAEKEFT